MGPTVVKASTGTPILVRLFASILCLFAAGAIALEMTALVHSGLSIDEAALRLSRFFTIITNLLLAILCGAMAIGRPRFDPARPLAAVATAMLLSGIVHVLMLRGVQSPSGIRQIASIVLHQVNPLMTLGLWLVATTRGRLTWRDPLIWSIFPLAYLAYALTRGATGEAFAYPFFDFRTLGWRNVLIASATIAAIFVVIGEMLVALDRALSKMR